MNQFFQDFYHVHVTKRIEFYEHFFVTKRCFIVLHKCGHTNLGHQYPMNHLLLHHRIRGVFCSQHLNSKKNVDIHISVQELLIFAWQGAILTHWKFCPQIIIINRQLCFCIFEQWVEIYSVIGPLHVLWQISFGCRVTWSISSWQE